MSHSTTDSRQARRLALASIIVVTLVLSIIPTAGLPAVQAAPTVIAPIETPGVEDLGLVPAPTEVPLSDGDLSVVSYSPDGTTLAVGTSTGIYLYNAVTFDVLQQVEPAAAVTSIAFSPDGAAMAAATVQGAVLVWQRPDWQRIQTLQANAGPTFAVAFSPDGSSLAAGYWDGIARLFDPDGQVAREFVGHNGRITALAFDAQGQRLVTGSTDGVLRFWNVATGQFIGKPVQTGPGEVSALAFSPSGNVLAAGLAGGSVRLWRGRDAAVIRTMQGHQGRVTSIAFSPDSALLVSGSADPTTGVRLWRVSDGSVLDGLQVGDGNSIWPVAGVTFAPDGQTIAIGAVNGQVRLWTVSPQLAQGGPGIGRLPGQAAPVSTPPPPPPPPPTTAPPPPPPPPLPFPVLIELSVSDPNVNAGDEVIVRARVEGVRAAWLDGDPVVGGYREKKTYPCNDATYTLNVELPDFSYTQRQAHVNVSGTCATPAPTATTGPTGQPDLTASVALNYGLLPGRVTAVVTFQNIGTAPAQNFVVYLQFPGGDFPLGTVPNLAPGGSGSFNRVLTGMPVGGVIKGTVDWLNAVAESNEGNNVGQATVEDRWVGPIGPILTLVPPIILTPVAPPPIGPILTLLPPVILTPVAPPPVGPIATLILPPRVLLTAIALPPTSLPMSTIPPIVLTPRIRDRVFDKVPGGLVIRP